MASQKGGILYLVMDMIMNDRVYRVPEHYSENKRFALNEMFSSLISDPAVNIINPPFLTRSDPSYLIYILSR